MSIEGSEKKEILITERVEMMMMMMTRWAANVSFPTRYMAAKRIGLRTTAAAVLEANSSYHFPMHFPFHRRLENSRGNQHQDLSDPKKP